MNIIYDNLIYRLQKAGGISTYWSELTQRLIRDKANIHFVENSDYNDNIARKNLSIKQKQILKNNDYPLFIDRFLSLPLTSFQQKFIFHSSYNRITSNRNAVHIMTVHDFVHERFYKGIRKILHSYQKNKSLNKAEIIISVSENTKIDLLNLHPNLNPTNVRVVYNGVSDDFYITGKKDAVRPYLLFIGSREHYKNFEFVVKLLKETPEFDLYIIGSELTKSEKRYLSLLKPERFKLLNNINNSYLNQIYNSAYALIYPSSYEGFGIPLLEAMKAGLPFVALNKSSIPEVAGNAGILIDELNLELFKKALYSIDIDRNSLIKRGLLQSQKFSWEKCYQETKNIYKELSK